MSWSVKLLSFPPAGVDEDVDVAVALVPAHGVRHDAAKPVEALAHVHRLVVKPVPAGPVQAEHYLTAIISRR